MILQNKTTKQSFITVKRINLLTSKIDKDARYKAARFVKSFKRCVYNTEDTYRVNINTAANHGKGFLDIMGQEDTIEVVNLHKNLQPEDYDSPLFNSIMES
jgi:hypothetical protein